MARVRTHDGLVGIELELGASKTGRVLQRGRSERVDSVLDDPEMDQQVARRWVFAPRCTSRFSPRAVR